MMKIEEEGSRPLGGLVMLNELAWRSHTMSEDTTRIAWLSPRGKVCDTIEPSRDSAYDTTTL
jgi:hypothetical protein